MHYNDWLKENPDGTPREYVAWARAHDVRPNLRGANLSEADLSGAITRQRRIEAVAVEEAR